MNTNNILSQIANTPQPIGARHYFFATDKGTMPTPPSAQGYPGQLEALKLGWSTMKWERYFIQWEAKEGAKPVFQIYLVQKDSNVPVSAEVFEALTTHLHREYSKLSVLKQAPAGKK